MTHDDDDFIQAIPEEGPGDPGGLGGFVTGVEMDIEIVSDVEDEDDVEVKFENLKIESFADKLNRAIDKKGSCICVGLDPRLSQIPACIVDPITAKFGFTPEAASKALLEFNRGIIDAVCDLVPIVKPQIAFYEQYGFFGYLAFEETCRYAKSKGLMVIADVKRSDIGTTAQAYANYFLGEVEMFDDSIKLLDVDAVTVNPYMGYDSVKPFIDTARKFGKGVFILVKTSNPSSGDIQDRFVDGGNPVYEMVAQFTESWGSQEIGKSGYSSVGAVVGATYPAEAAKLRKLMPETIFLVPGYGAQGGSAAEVAPCFNKDGRGAIINSSRGIIFAYEKVDGPKDGSHFEAAAHNAVLEMKKDLNSIF
ncbi:MAG: orotidine-5'-phosphate decarboxylase [Candidatus Peregrinibacteria bacterium]|nr:orotidine-5'-phosphate decarboxylase [Candidatus Peregrinibacteria bacterium]MDZ4245312.1 orotidine-5'-phosphate decarboxylase [Candidatus Gracilibacteria bacterium]